MVVSRKTASWNDSVVKGLTKTIAFNGISQKLAVLYDFSIRLSKNHYLLVAIVRE